MNARATVLICALVSALGPQSTPPAPATAPASVRGQVTDRETGAPIPRALVRVETSRADGTRVVRQNSTDLEGRFEFLNLPSGFLQVSATGGEHRATYIREYYPPRGGRSGGPSLMLKDGEVRSDVHITLRRSLAISGRVTDEFGMPLASVPIRLAPADGGYIRQSVPQRWTDDRGMYRLFGVSPGDYVVCADIDQRHDRVRVAPPVERFVNTCHPSALTDAEAQTVSVRSADVDGIEIRVRQSRTFVISGNIVDSTGTPADSPTVMFHRYRRDGGTAGGGQMPGGRFEFTGLVPGQYGIGAMVGVDESSLSRGPFLERGYVAVSIDGADVTGLVVTMKKPATVRGQIMFEDGAPARQGEPLTIEAQSAERSAGLPIRPAVVAEDLTFTLTELFGPVRLSVRGTPRGWVVKSIRYRGEDITEGPAEFTIDPRQPIEVVLTSRVARSREP